MLERGLGGEYIVNKMLSKYDKNIKYFKMVTFRKAYCGDSDNFSNVPQPSDQHDQGFCWRGVEVKNNFGAMQRRENIFQAFLWVQGHVPPETFEKGSVQDKLKSHFWTLLAITDSLISSSKNISI